MRTAAHSQPFPPVGPNPCPSFGALPSACPTRPRGAWLSGLLLGLACTVVGEGWQRVINLDETPGSAIGGGAGNTLYAGMNSGPVYRSDDNGATWTAVTNGLVDEAGRFLLPKAFVVTPTGRVIRGGDNASWQNRVGSPVFHTDDRGGHWAEVPLPFASPARNPAGIAISDLVLHQGAVYFADLLSEGVWKSTDDGATWTAAGDQLPTLPFLGTTKTYYAIASAGHALLTVQASKGVFRSTDGGLTWTQAVNGIPGVPDSPLVGGRTWNATDVIGRADGTAFAVSDGRLYLSRNAGASWSEVGAGILVGPNPFVPSVIEPKARKVELLGDRVYVSTTDGNPRFFEGDALGESWTELPRVEGNEGNAGLLAQSFYAHNDALYFAGNKGIHRLDLATASRTPIAPVVTVTPAAPLFANVGSTLTATATARGTAPFSFEWRLDNTPLPGQTAAVLAFSPTGTGQSGTLSVVVANAAGRVTNSVGQLIVAAGGPGNPDFAFRPQSAGAVTAFAIAPDGGVFYGGPFSSQVEAYTGVRRTFPDGQIDPTFVTGAVIGSGSGPGASAGSPRTLLPLGDGSVLVGAANTPEGARYYRRLLPDGTLDATWPWPGEVAGGPRKIVRLADGRFLMAGGSLGGIHRLNVDGTFDPTFQGPASIGRFQANYVSDFALLPDGRILLAGAFNDVDGAPRVGLARLLPGGQLDRSWVPAGLPAGSEVSVLQVQPDGRILFGGTFQTVGGQARPGVARLNADGSLDTTFAPALPPQSPGPVVNALALDPGGKVWIGGRFYVDAAIQNLVRLNADGTVDAGVATAGLTTGPVNLLRLTDDGRLWLSANDVMLDGQFIGNFLRLFTDRTGPALGYAGFDQNPDPGTSITLRGTVTGTFTGLQWRFQGTPISGATGLELPLGNVTLAASGAYDLVVTSAGGSHTSAPVNVRVRGPVVIDQGPVPAVVVLSNSVTLAVSAFGRLPLGYQWLKDGEILANATNRTLALTNLQLTATGDYAVTVTGGDGTSATSEPAFVTVVPPPGSTNSAFRPGLPVANGFRDLAFLPDGRAIVAGGFAGRLARLATDGSVDPAFQFDATGLTDSLALERQPDGRLLVLLRLSTGGGPYVVRRLNEDGSVDPGFADAPPLGNHPSDLRLAPDGGILLVSQSGIERLNPDGSPDPGFNQRARLDNEARSVDLDAAGRIYVTGFFSTVGGQPRAQLARLQPDGTLDASFAPTHSLSGSSTVTALADGALVGDLNGFHRFTETGTRDSGYGWGTRLAAWDVSPTGLLFGVLNDTQGNGVIRSADGAPASPFSTMKVPAALYGYSFLRVAPDGAIWLAKGAIGAADPATLLYRLHGTVTPLAFTLQPASQLALAGARVTLTAAATGTSRITYQWRRNGLDLPGETNATLTLPSFSAATAGDYAVVASNRSGSLTSRTATVTLLAAPAITGQPASLVLSRRQEARFTVTVEGLQLRYQWRAGTTDLAGETNATLVLPSVSADSAGTYSVRVTNPAGEVVSRSALLRIRPEPGTGSGGGPTEGLAARLRFEGNFTEEVGGFVTTLTGSPGFDTGIEGTQAASLRSGMNWVRIGTGTGAGGRIVDDRFTLSFWIKPETGASLNACSLILLTPNATPGTFTAREQFLWLGGNDNSTFGHRVYLGTRTFNAVTSADDRAYVPNLVGRWTHVAVVYRGTSPADPANFDVYVDGQAIPLAGGPAVGGTVSLVNALGRYTPSARFQMDDFRIYNRPLSAAEVTSLVTPPAADPAPVINLQPSGATVPAGSTHTFTVTATGPNLFYEWFRGETLLPDADGPSLTLAGLSAADAGDYRVTLSNNGGSTDSAPATLVVTAPADPFADWAAAAGLTGDAARPETDADTDNWPNIAEFYHGTSPGSPDSAPEYEVSQLNVDGAEYPAVTFLRRQEAGGVALDVEVSADVAFAMITAPVVVSVTPLGDGLERVILRSPTPASPGQPTLFRLTLRR